jgi:hypothetical protein
LILTKCLERFGFSLHPAYTIHEIYKSKTHLKIEIKKKNNFVDLFEDEHVNVKVICGKNGSGKTTLLSLLERSNSEQCIYLFKDKKWSLGFIPKNRNIIW